MLNAVHVLLLQQAAAAIMTTQTVVPTLYDDQGGRGGLAQR